MESLALQFVGIAFATFIAVAAKAFQQLNVMHDVRSLVPAMTFIMATCEVIIIGNIAVEVTSGTTLGVVVTVFAMTLGGATGALSSMSLHKRLRARMERKENG